MIVALTDSETIIGGLLIWTLLVVAIWLTRRLLLDDKTLWVRWRFGFFFEREPNVERDPAEYDWDENGRSDDP